MWCVVELNLGILGGCVTALRPFVRRYFPRLLGLSSHSGGNAYYPSQSRGNSLPLHSIPRSQPNFSNHGHQFSTAYKSGADNSSEEHILGTPPGKETDGIVRTVEFDVKQTGSHA